MKGPQGSFSAPISAQLCEQCSGIDFSVIGLHPAGLPNERGFSKETEFGRLMKNVPTCFLCTRTARFICSWRSRSYGSINCEYPPAIRVWIQTARFSQNPKTIEGVARSSAIEKQPEVVYLDVMVTTNQLPPSYTYVRTTLRFQSYLPEHKAGPSICEDSASSDDIVFPYSGRLQPTTIDFGLPRKWLQICRSEHSRRCVQHKDTKIEIIRLIDVEEMRVEVRQSIPCFVALSYVWGRATSCRLTKKSLSCISIIWLARRGHTSKDDRRCNYSDPETRREVSLG